MARIDCTTGDVEWTMAGYNDGSTGAFGTGKPILDGPGGNVVGRMVPLLNVTGGAPRGPSVSAPAIDAAGNVWFLAAIENFDTADQFDDALIRAVYDPDSFSFELERVLRQGGIYTGQNSGLPYQIGFIALADSNSISSGTMWSQNINQFAVAGLDPSTLEPADPRTLGGIVMTASITYDFDGDGMFTRCDGVPAGNDPEYNVLLYIGATTNQAQAGQLEPCPNDFEEATASPSGGTGGERLSRFICVAAPQPPAAARQGPGTALRITLKTMYNTTAGDPDGANVCPATGRIKPDLTQFEGHVRWAGTPAALADDAVPPPPDYVAVPLVCTGAEAEVRDWSQAALAAAFPTADPTRIYFYGSEVVPFSVYEVSQCTNPLDEGTCSTPVLIRTGKLGDCWPVFAPSPGQPAFVDIGATVAKFKSLPFSPGTSPTGAPPEWHALVRGNVVGNYDVSTTRKVDFIDIGRTVDSFKSIAYREDGPCNPMTGVDNCGNPCSKDP